MRLHGAIIANEHILSTNFLRYGSWNLKRELSRMKVYYSSSVDLLNKSKTEKNQGYHYIYEENINF